MTWSKRIRQIHRWSSIVFTATVIASFVVLFQGATPEDPAFSVFYLPLPPLALQLFTGLYMFVLPYTTRRGGQRAAREA